MSDLISRQDAIDAITKAFGMENHNAVAIIKSLPSADRATGKWVDREYCQVDEDSYEVAICSECGAEITIEYPYDSYCPNCGAKMEGDTE